MSILTHGSDLSLAPTARPLARQTGGALKPALSSLSSEGFVAVQLDATMPGLRPRELDRAARRDLIAALTRRSLRLAGLDLFIPRKHFADIHEIDRAMGAALAGLELAADLGHVPVSLALPVKSLSADARATLVEAADARSVRLAVHAEDQIDELLTWINEVDLPALGAAIDPAALIALGQNPAEVAHRLGARTCVARLSDFQITAGDEGDDRVAGVRCPVGEGDLDVSAYRVAVDLAQHRAGPVVLDLRGQENARQAALAAKAQWSDASFTL